jgi:hypothetical protein
MKIFLILYIIFNIYLALLHFRVFFHKNITTLIKKIILGMYIIFNIALLITTCLMKM